MDQVGGILAGVTALLVAVTALLVQVHKLEIRVDGRLTELLELTRKSSKAEGRLEGPEAP